MKTLKAEEVNGKTYAIDDARRDIGAFIEMSTTPSAFIRRSAINRRLSSKPISAPPAIANQKQKSPCHPISRVSAKGCTSE